MTQNQQSPKSPAPEVYSLRDFGDMNADADRFGAYSKAIEKAVRPGDTVAEIGCGSGVFALLACRAGARRVYAIETDPVVEVARQLATANGLEDRIEFFQRDSRRTELPERVNAIISDIRGILPFYDHAIPSMEDARARFLAPGGVMIPQRDVLKAAILEADEFYSRLITPWRKRVSGLDLSSSLQMVLNATYGGKFKNEQLLTDPQGWCVLDYTVGATSRANAELRFYVNRRGTAHGVCLWFETQLCEGIGYSSAPGSDATIYGQLFLPWLETVRMAEGQEINLQLQADLVGEDYVWRWETRIPAHEGQPDICFQQSTFQGATFSPQSLRRRAVDYVPVLTDEAHAERWLLDAMDGRTSLQEIAQAAAQRFPKVFPRQGDALQRAMELAERLSK